MNQAIYNRVMNPGSPGQFWPLLPPMDRSTTVPTPVTLVPRPQSPWVQREADTFTALQNALAQQPTAYQPPPSMMLPRLRPEWLLGLGLLGALDPTKTVVPQFVQGFAQGGMMNSQNEAQRRQAAIEAEREAAQLRLKSAELEHQRAAEMLDADQRAQARADEIARQDARFREEQDALTERAKIGAEGRLNVANVGAGQRTVKELLDIYGSDRLDGPSRASAAQELRRRGILNVTDEEIAQLGAYKAPSMINAETNKEDKEATRAARIAKMRREVEESINRNLKRDADRQLVLKKVENYDDEFKLRAANVHSMIAKRSKPSGTAPSMNQQRLLLERLISINNAQIKKLGFTPSDLLRRSKLENEINDAVNQLRLLVHPVPPNAGMGGVPGKPEPDGLQGPITKKGSKWIKD